MKALPMSGGKALPRTRQLPVRYAVCIRLPDPAGKRPRLFSSRRAALSFLDADVFPGDTNPDRITNRDQGWRDPVPVVALRSLGGQPCTKSINALPLNRIESALTRDSRTHLVKALRGQSSEFTCVLAPDWKFEKIAEDARQRGGHYFEGLRQRDVAGIVVNALYDLETSLQLCHSHLSCRAVASFWRSWDMQSHISDFCREAAATPTVKAQFGSEAELVLHRARETALEQLAAFAHEIGDWNRTGQAEQRVRQSASTAARGKKLKSDNFQLVENYIAEVLRHAGKRITKTDIWKRAGYKSRTEFERWQRNSHLATRTAQERFERLLTSEKPHLH